MPKINREEYEVLKELDDKWKWIARDEDTTLWAYEDRPRKGKDDWDDSRDDCEYLGGQDFQFIQWSDDEPYNIAELIEEYENTIVITEYVDGKWRNRIKESEETEVKKNIEWAKEETHKELDSWRNVEGGIDDDGINEVLNIIDQLDEPEVLSSDWIEENKFKVDNWNEAVHVDDLQNLLVPKQEEITEEQAWQFIADNYSEDGAYWWDVKNHYESLVDKVVIKKPTVPKRGEMKVSKTWHDVIAQNKEEGHSLRWTLNYIDNLNVNDVDDFAKAWLAYPNIQVEEEQKYYVIDKDDNILLLRGYDGVEKADNLKIHNSGGGALKLTEQEIKDYDERYLPFKVKVEELEE